MTIKHTPGPWQFDTAVRNAQGQGFITAGSIDARVMREPPSGCAVIVATVKHDADGALLAAAPDLLAALIDAENMLDQLRHTRVLENETWDAIDKAVDAARAAIAKASP